MKNKIVWTVYHTGMFCLKVLFFYGLSVNLSMFYDGMTSAWITLFTWMTMSGALGLQFLIELLIENKKEEDEIENSSMFVNAVLVVILISISDIRVGGIVLLCNGLDCFLRYKNKNWIYSICMFVSSMILWNTAYLQGWITISKYIFFLCIETVFLFQYLPKQEKKDSISKDKKQIVIQTILQLLKNGCILGVFVVSALAMIQIHQEGTLFYFKNIIVYYLGLGIGLILISIIEQKYKPSSISQRIAFGITMIGIAIWTLQKSMLFSFVILLVGASFIALEILLNQLDKQMSMDGMSRVLLCVVLLILQNVYDGIYMNYQTVFIVMYMMLGIVIVISRFSKLER